jgi:GT2 family glycosyltransferase
VVLVDNNSQDGSLEYAKSISEMDLWILRSSRNEGYARANNIGAKLACKQGCRYILLLNTDAIIGENALKKMVGFLQENKTIAAVSPLILFKQDREMISYAGGINDAFRAFRHRGAYEILRSKYRKAIETDFLTGCCLLIRTDVLKKCKLFDERFFMYFEDADLSITLKEHGHRIVFLPDALVWHAVTETRTLERRFYYNYYLNRNKLLLLKKHMPRVLGSVYMDTFFKAAKSIFLFKFAKGIAVLRALFDFSRGRFGKL